MTPSDVMAEAIIKLESASIENPRREAELLWSAVFTRRFRDYDGMPEQADIRKYMDLVGRRAAREPMSHLMGGRDFYNHRFIVTPDVLDPRPDTETLVALALSAPFRRVLDLGTGSGCILLSLLAAQKDATGLGVDLSLPALEVAKRNRTLLELESRCDLRQSDWFEAVDGQFDLIVSNPPYIAASEVDELQPEVRDHEPRMALTDEGDGLGAYRSILAGVDAFLSPGGRLLVEIGPTQAAVVSNLMSDAGLTAVEVHQDLDGRDRVLVGSKPA